MVWGRGGEVTVQQEQLLAWGPLTCTASLESEVGGKPDD